MPANSGCFRLPGDSFCAMFIILGLSVWMKERSLFIASRAPVVLVNPGSKPQIRYGWIGRWQSATGSDCSSVLSVGRPPNECLQLTRYFCVLFDMILSGFNHTRLGCRFLATHLLLHLLKWKFQEIRRSRSWQLSIDEQRIKFEEIKLDDILKSAYRLAVIQASRATNLSKVFFLKIALGS